MGRKPKEIVPLPETITVGQLADLAGVTEKWIQVMAADGVIPASVGGDYSFRAAIKGIIAKYKEQASGQSADKARDQARQAKADADRAEMAAAKDAGTLMLTADAKRMWSDGFVKIRDVVVRSTLTARQKKEITEKMQKIKVEQS